VNPGDDRGTAEANDWLVRDFLAAWERRETEYCLERLSDEPVYHPMPLTPIAGRDAVSAWVRGFEGRPAARIEIHHQVAEGDVVMNERTDVISLNGKEVTLQICAVFECVGGRIRAWREYFDPAPAKAAYAAT
jgi:limonene-1,2-epoxide hydrolase